MESGLRRPSLAGLTRLVLLAAVVGVLTGVVGGTFRLLLVRAEQWRLRMVEAAGAEPNVRWLVPIVVAAGLVALARSLVRLAPEASGSGVQWLEAQMRGEVGPARLRVLPVKFVGGLLALGSGLALGREGPSVQMGAAVASGVSRAGGLRRDTAVDLSAAAGGAGLGVAFSAPIGGMLFTLEEVAGSFRPRLVLTTLVTVGAALATAQVIVGPGPDFTLTQGGLVSDWRLGVVVLLGLVCGVLGVLYNRMILLGLDLVARMRRFPPEVIAGLVGALVAIVALFSPTLVGGGDSVTQPLLVGTTPVATLLMLLLVRWLMGPASYAIGTPGGLFAPMLAIGALLGALLAALTHVVLPAAALPGPSLAVIGMAAFFTAVVRAPITAVVLTAELVGSTNLLIPMALAAGVATAVCVALKAVPIYETLRHRMEHSDVQPMR